MNLKTYSRALRVCMMGLLPSCVKYCFSADIRCLCAIVPLKCRSMSELLSRAILGRGRSTHKIKVKMKTVLSIEKKKTHTDTDIEDWTEIRELVVDQHRDDVHDRVVDQRSDALLAIQDREYRIEGFLEKLRRHE